MTREFSGDVAGYYAKYRRGYPPRAVDALQETFGLATDDVVLDLGCGTGQLALPLADRVRSVIGMDPEPDMLRLAGDAAAEQGIGNATWILGGDRDVPALQSLLGRGSLAMAVIGNAIHWMRHEELFAALVPLLRPGGGIAVVANGTPLWLQENNWSPALRTGLERYFGISLATSCGTLSRDRDQYRRALRAAGLTEVRETAVDYTDELTLEQLVGGVCSAVPADRLPAPADRPAFTEYIRQCLPAGQDTFTEEVRVAILTGRA
ncbi:class I SAM-dependent methyltransferase [Kitasatospora purpeofusca]|uniref:class I SAM-dependent methyltransferase n=1 Tax=Kitasatospora purpeofusca TaxID=67352 RepID=UPI002A5A4626|nr:methyltransferase domain-containing protein [Kitasatospora purpeofusca]MDY0813109.1 methyltransferase domain-containing protein [Kitasatospora purpeofusca]